MGAAQQYDLSAGVVDSPAAPGQGYDLSEGVVDAPQFAPPPGTPDINSTVAKPNVQMQSASAPARLATSLAAGTGDLLQTAAAVRGQGAPDQYNSPLAEAYYKRTGDWKGAVQMATGLRLGGEPSMSQVAKDIATAPIQQIKDISSEAKYDLPDAVGDAVPFAATIAAGEGEAKNLTAESRAGLVENRITKLIKPTTGDLRYGADPAGAIAKEGLTYNSLEDLGDKVYARARDVGQTIDQILQSGDNPAKTVNISEAVNGPIDDMIRQAAKNGDEKLYNNLQNLKEQLNNNWEEVKDPKTGKMTLQISGPRDLAHMSPLEATQFKRAVADMTRFDVNDVTSNEVNGVKAAIFGRVKDAVNQAVPEVAQWNKRYADLVNAGKAIERRNPVLARNASWSLGDMGAAGLGVAMGHTPAGVALAAAHKIARSPSFVSRVSNALYPEALRYEEPAAARARLQFQLQSPPGRVPPATQETLPFNEGFSQDMQTGPNGPLNLQMGERQAPAAQRPLPFHENPDVYPSAARGESGPPEGTPENPRRMPPSSRFENQKQLTNGERRVTPRNGHTFTEAERQRFLEEQRRVEAARHPNPHLKENPFDRHPSHSETIRAAAKQEAMDILGGKKPKGTHIR